MAINVQTAVTEAFYELPPIQVDIRMSPASPEGSMEAPPGIMVVIPNGNLYVKKSQAGSLTGWKLVTTAA